MHVPETSAFLRKGRNLEEFRFCQKIRLHRRLKPEIIDESGNSERHNLGLIKKQLFIWHSAMILRNFCLILERFLC